MAVAATSTGASLPNGPAVRTQPRPGQHLVGEPGVDQPEIRDAHTDSLAGDLDAQRADQRLDTGLRRHIRAHQRARYHGGDRGHHHHVSAARLQVRQRGPEVWKAPTRLTSMTCRHSAGSTAATVNPGPAMPALATTTSMTPKCPAAAAQAACTDSADVTSASNAAAADPSSATSRCAPASHDRGSRRSRRRRRDRGPPVRRYRGPHR